MLLRYLLRRDASSASGDLSFRTRGAEVSRLEGFSDAVFGFAITLLVISSRAPDTSTELLALRHAVIPFVASFAVLFALWRAQFDFFRRYGLEDQHTVRLTGALLMIVLLAVYPVKFLFTFMLDVLPVALWAGNDSMKPVMPMENLPKVLMLYAIGFAGVAFVFSRLYRHAAKQHAEIGLSALELFDTRVIQRRWTAMSIGGVALALWCLLLLSLGVHTTRRDFVWTMVYQLMLPAILVMNVVQLRASRRLARARRTLVDSGRESEPGAELSAS